MSHNIFRNRRDLGLLLNPSQLLATDYRRYVPILDLEKVSFQSIQPSTILQVILTFNIDIGKKIIVDFGNDYSVELIGTGSNMNAVSNYSINNTTYNINISGDLNYVRTFLLNNYTIKILTISEIGKFLGLKTLHLTSCQLNSGSLSDLPTGLIYLYWYNLSNLIVTGTLSDLPRGLTNIVFQNLSNLIVTGTLSDLPTGLVFLYWYNLPNLTVTGTLSGLPTGLTSIYWYILPNFNVTGSLSGLPSGLTVLFLYNLSTLITGSLSDLPRGLTSLYWYNLPNFNITGTLSDLPSGLVYFVFQILPNLIVNSSAILSCSNVSTLRYYTIGDGIITLDISICTKISGPVYFDDNALLQTIISPTAFTAAITEFKASNCALDVATVDSIFAKLNAWYTLHPPTANLIVNVEGGTNASPTGGGSNSDILNLISIFATAGKVFSYLIN
jgi:hypothetical protein